MNGLIKGFAVFAVIVFAADIMGFSWFWHGETEVSVHTVAPGTECAIAGNAKGVAMSCWKVAP